MEKLFTTQFGSSLYGTKTPTSDIDWKHVVLPSLDSLLLGKKPVNVVKKTNNVKNTRNSVDDTDEEFVPLQVFASDFFNGQTYALELAFALNGTHAEQKFYGHEVMFKEFVLELKAKFLTSNIKAMMGYVVNQTSLYTFKGERLNAARGVLSLLSSVLNSNPAAAEKKLQDLLNDDDDFLIKLTELSADFPKYFSLTDYLDGGGSKKPAVKLLDKLMPMSMTLKHAIGVVSKVMEKYGSRSEAAMESNVDWKATMHALRIVDEGLNLLQFHKLEFPFDEGYASHLLMVKRGAADLESVKEELSSKLNRLKELEQTTMLPAGTYELRAEFETWLAGWLRKFYNV